MRRILKSWIPPILLKLYKKMNIGGIRFRGRYYSWEDASKSVKGYGSKNIFEKVKASSLKVKNGESPCERDSVLFNTPQYSWPSLACLMYAAACKGKLSVLDFGGSLGSLYFLNRVFLNNLDVEWSIVEQRHFVEFGRDKIADEALQFYFDLDDCYRKRRPNFLLLSSVIQYLKDPYSWLEVFVNLEIDFILLDKTTFSKRQDEFIQIQEVPKAIYRASYPMHVLSEDKIVDFIKISGFELIESFTPEASLETSDFYTKSFFFRRASNK